MRRLVVLPAFAGMILLGLLAVSGCGDDSDTSPARNGPITFFGGGGSGEEIYTMHPDGTGVRRLTNVEGDALFPDWSPDGTRIAFWESGRPTSARRVDYIGYVMNADGSDLHQVTARDTSAEFPAFTPDGDHLVYDCEYALDKQGDPGQYKEYKPCPEGDGSVFLMRDNGSDFPGRRLTTNPFPRQSDRGPKVSPDGQTVTFVRIKKGEKLQALYAVEIDGSDVRRLTTYRLDVALGTDWAPNGRRIVLTTHADYQPDHKSPNVATMRPDGSHLRMLTHYTGGKQGAFNGSYSPDGRWILFRVENLKQERFRLYKMHPDGTHRELIKSLPFPTRHADWGTHP